VVDYNDLKQRSLLQWLGIENPDWRDLGMGFAATLITFLVILSIHFARLYSPASRDPAKKVFDDLCKRLTKQVAKDVHEGPQHYLQRATKAVPHRAAQLSHIALLYIALRYEPRPQKEDLKQLKKLVRQI
jgi:protein-glutamine gamma-glutamyltransferase